MSDTIKVSSRFQYARLVSVFGMPQTPDPQAHAGEFCRVLSGYDAAIAQEAIDRIIAKAKFFPRPGEVSDAVAEVVERRRIMNPQREKDHVQAPANWRRPSADEKARVRAMIDARNAVVDAKTAEIEARAVEFPDIVPANVLAGLPEIDMRDAVKKSRPVSFRMTGTSRAMALSAQQPAFDAMRDASKNGMHFIGAPK